MLTKSRSPNHVVFIRDHAVFIRDHAVSIRPDAVSIPRHAVSVPRHVVSVRPDAVFLLRDALILARVEFLLGDQEIVSRIECVYGSCVCYSPPTLMDNDPVGRKKILVMSKKPLSFAGPFTLDLTSIKDSIVDLPPGDVRHLNREKDNFSAVVSEIQAVTPEVLQEIGLSPALLARITERTEILSLVRKRKFDADKMAEVLKETEAYIEDAREADIAIVARTIQAAVQRLDPAVGARFEGILEYYSQTANKAAATRRKNKAEAERQREENEETAKQE